MVKNQNLLCPFSVLQMFTSVGEVNNLNRFTHKAKQEGTEYVLFSPHLFQRFQMFRLDEINNVVWTLIISGFQSFGNYIETRFEQF